ncbi:hypothetical protein GGR54DRAFT_334491 [Hypoxylon sp. NC1633]|nr:hypothetical protein GGR54DRAFT_334491 [Hypoxylon sp. NC1633]
MLDFQTTENELPFINITPTKQSAGEKRKVIRSHVMRGKNRKKPPPRPLSWIDSCQAGNVINNSKDNYTSIPGKIGGEFSLTPFSAEINSGMIDTMLKLKEAMSPLAFGLSPIQSKQSWLEPIWRDAACLHFSIYIAKTYRDFVEGRRGSNETALAHFLKSVRVLQHRLASSDSELPISDSTILVVVGLATAAVAFGDFETASNHIGGLHKMVILRGSISAFSKNRNLQAKILRADLGAALAKGSRPRFFSNGVSWDPYFTSRGKTPILGAQGVDPTPQTPSPGLNYFLRNTDVRLRFIWEDLSELVRSINIAMQCNLGIDSELYHEVMISIHYRLVNLCLDADDASEAFRLASLSFSATLFLQGRGVKINYRYLAQSLEVSLSRLRCHIRAMPAQVALWIYVVGALSVLGEREKLELRPVLTTILLSTKSTSWNQVRLLLKSILWVDALFDLPAKEIVEPILCSIESK